MKSETMLMIPGPTPVPHKVLEALAKPMIGHRSEDFKKVLKDVFPKLQWIFQTKSPVFIYAASGTGAMEAALVNTVNPGDEILVLSCGVFSARWAEIAKAIGITVHLQTAEPGKATDIEELKRFLKGPNGKNIKAVCMIHSETSTSVLNNVEALSKTIRENSDALVIVDAVTSLGAAPFLMDEWGIDIAVSGSQKGFMLPPGLAFLAAGKRAMDAHAKCKNPGYYFNFAKHEKGLPDGQTPYTPAVSLITGLGVALDMMSEEGLQGIWERHRINQSMTRKGLEALGLELFVKEENFASPAATAALPPSGISVDIIRKGLREDYSITIANGQKELLGKIFRIGHLGAIFPRDVLMTLSCLDSVLRAKGYNKSAEGAAVKAAQAVLKV